MSRIKRFLDSDAFPITLAVVMIVATGAALAGVVELIRLVQAGA